MTRTLTYVAALLACLGLAAGFLDLSPWASLGLVLLGAAWAWGLSRRWAWVSTAGLFLSCGAAVAGIIRFEQPPLFPVLGACLALLAWDLAGFEARLRRASPEDDVAGLVKRHFLRLGGVAIVAGGILLLARAWQMQRLGFEVVAILIVIGTWGMGRIAYWMQRGR